MTRVQAWPVAVFLAGLSFFYVGERLFPADATMRLALDAVG